MARRSSKNHSIFLQSGEKAVKQRLHNHVEVVAARHGEIALLMAARSMKSAGPSVHRDQIALVPKINVSISSAMSCAHRWAASRAHDGGATG